jgi:hypothetical protein
MKLIVDRLDLLPEHEDTNCSQVRLVHFKPDVQIAIIAAGGATFREFDGSNYNRILLDGAEPDEPVRRIDLLKSINKKGTVTLTSRMSVSESDGLAGQLLEWCIGDDDLTGDVFSDLVEAMAHYYFGPNLSSFPFSDKAKAIVGYVDTVLFPGASNTDKLFCLYNATWWVALWGAEQDALAPAEENLA